MNNLFLIEADFGRHGRVFIETDRDKNSRKQVVDLIRSGEVFPIKVIEICEDEGWVRNVTDEIVKEAEQPREPASWDEIGNRLQALWDHAFDVRKNWEGAQ